MSRFQIILTIFAIALIGWLQLIYKLRHVNQKEKYALEYLNKFKKYIESQGKNNETYGWMIYESVKMQRQLEILGIMLNYKPPGANYMHKNYQVLLNMLPELHRTFNSDFPFIPRLVSDYIQVLEEMLVRHLGVLNEEKKDIQSEILNPFKALREGIQFILLLPAYILNWLGLATDSFLWRLSRNTLFKIISSIVAIVGFASALVGLIVGWKDFVVIIRSMELF